MKIEYIDRGEPGTLVLIPGWAADCRVFAALDLPGNYLYADPFWAPGLASAVADEIRRRSLAGVTLFGWSAGGYTALEVYRCCPGRVARVLLAGFRPSYPADALHRLRAELQRNRCVRLKLFYRDWFTAATADARRVFAATVQPAYLSHYAEPELMAGLDRVGRAAYHAADLAGVPVSFIHGVRDRIAPVEEVRALEDALPAAGFHYVPDAGHAVHWHSAGAALIRELAAGRTRSE